MLFGFTKRTVLWTILLSVLGIILLALLYAYFFGPTQPYGLPHTVVVEPSQSVAEVAHTLKAEGYIKSELVFRGVYLLSANTPARHERPGGFTLSSAMDLWSIVNTLVSPPYLAWVTIPTGLRKEQVADILSDALSWSDAQKKQWLTVDTTSSSGFTDGIYYGGTYLIPTDQSTAQVAARLRASAEDAYAPYAAEAAQQGKNWQDVLTMASLIEREAGKSDKALVSGILWNRLDEGMPLAVDATLQYLDGHEGNWWPQPKAASTYPATAFNTYKKKGLPPTPIDTPSIASVAAALYPQATNCLFYLHDPSHQIHCSPTYSGQQKNVVKYLK